MAVSTKSNTAKEKSSFEINKKQTFIGLGLILIMTILSIYLHSRSYKLSMFLITGLAIGYVMQRSRFGFAGTVRKMYIMGNGSLTKAVLFLFIISMIGTAAIHYSAVMSGAESIPGFKSVKPINMGTIIGGVLFGIGMFGGGCASGTLTDLGEGHVRSAIVLFFFIVGTILGVNHMPAWEKSIFFAGSKVYLPDIFGYMGAMIVSLLGFLAIYIFVKKYEDKRKRENTFIPETYADWEKELPEEGEYKFFSKETYHKFFVKRWSFYTGASLLAILFLAIILTTGSSWGVTSNFANWGAWLFGIDVSNWPWFAKKLDVINGGFFNDPKSLRNLGIIIGAMISPLLAGQFSFNTKFNLKDVVFYAIGGLFMGYGARISLGCNIGAFYAPIANLSLSGWVFMVALVIGGIIGISLVKKLDINS
ncbi:YeeE/YedE family protein [Caldisalinibacter kiritimatiensis]|uniref:Uncharacterized protein n=1 Tax=Caldisalinibacter kiritimatiensis TaxID=1304284 RepID=R1AWI3_9FIRM|nr:YeeE/YedE family protein [Caldisalinibacter kiritimatiensis]EOD00977.1 hypothetical protein L21TH_0962 [Caldisalinibacter kiritimatiensis]